VAWEKSRDRWLEGNINGQEDWEDVRNWIEKDPIWKNADSVSIKKKKGSHHGHIFIRGISQVLPDWGGDHFAVSTTGGRWVKKWIVEQLVKGYRELQGLTEE